VAKSPSRPYTLISVDGHAGADLLDYREYLEVEYYDEFDVWAAAFSEPWSEYDREMTDTDDEFLRIGQASFLSPYNWDSDKRLEHMNEQGIVAEVLFPNTVPPFYPVGAISAWAPRDAEEYRLRQQGVKAHNRWLVDFCGMAPGRRLGLAQVFLNDLDDAIAEVRWAKEHGLAGILIPSDHMWQLVNIFERRLDPFWAVCQELEMPVHRHAVAVGYPESAESGPAVGAVGGHETMLFFSRGLGQLIYGGVFERFPDLSFVFTETGLMWIPRELLHLDAEYHMGTTKGQPAYPTHHRALDELSMLPSEYFRRNVHIGASLMTSYDIAVREEVGVDRIMWGADYPHHEGLFPHTPLGLRSVFADLPEAEVRRMTSLNAAEVYDLDLDYLQIVGDEIGPTPEEVATPLTPQELPPSSMSVCILEAISRVGGQEH
jgi:predicted TIM-barrel fold metal-dependent hydrolase